MVFFNCEMSLGKIIFYSGFKVLWWGMESQELNGQSLESDFFIFENRKYFVKQ